jgi:hypothetical protein
MPPAPQVTPPTTEEVSRRLSALKVVCVFALSAPPRPALAEMSRAWSPSEKNQFEAKAKQHRDDFWKRVKDSGLFAALTPKERELAGVTVATMTARQQLDASWRVEAVAVLLWALGGLEALPGYDEPVDHAILKQPLGDALLRPEAELARARDVAELWHWRGRTRELAERGPALVPTPKMIEAGIRSYDDIVRASASLGHERGTLPPPIDGDFAVKGKAYRALSAGEWAAVRSMSAERHFALNWLCGRAPGNRWDETPTDT